MVPAEEGLSELLHGSLVTLDIQTATGISGRFRTHFIGQLPNHYLLFQTPKSSNELLMDPGNIAKVRGVCQQGEGAIVAFRSTILHHINHPHKMFATTIPGTVLLHLLRAEPRFELHITAEGLTKSNILSGSLEDLSCSGCCFSCDTTNQLEDNTSFAINVNGPGGENKYTLTGVVRNQRLKGNKRYLGVSLDNKGRELAVLLMQKVIEQGAKDSQYSLYSKHSA